MVALTKEEQLERDQRLGRGEEVRAILTTEDMTKLYARIDKFSGLVEGMTALYVPLGQEYDPVEIEPRVRGGLIAAAIDNIIVRTRNEKGDAFTGKDSGGIRALVERELSALYRGYPRRTGRHP
jgi:hypothetical protein